jgi:hypothetical protein
VLCLHFWGLLMLLVESLISASFLK